MSAYEREADSPDLDQAVDGLAHACMVAPIRAEVKSLGVGPDL
jgi:hypothetical protein